MYNFLIISSKEGNSYKSLTEQINYLKKFRINITLLIDPSELELVNEIENKTYDCAYVHVRKRIKSQDSIIDVTRLLEYYNIPLIGNNSFVQLFIADKRLVSYKSGIGLQNAVITRNMWKRKTYPQSINELLYPLIVKPNNFHASQGISEDSIVNNLSELDRQISFLFEKYKNLDIVLIERYIKDSREYTVSVLGNSDSFATSVTKLQYKNQDVHVYSEFDKLSKLDDRSFEFVIEDEEKITNRLSSLSIALFKYFNLKDIARFDYIISDSVYLLEANACPIPGNSFTWEWQIKYGLKKEQTIALFLCAFHFAQISSFRNDNLPWKLIMDLPTEIIKRISHPEPIYVCPECTEITNNCKTPQLYHMNSRVGSEVEILNFLKHLTIMLKPKTILETGTYDGNGTLAFAEATRINGFGKVISLEYDTKLSNIAKNNLSQYSVEIINTSSLSYVPQDTIDLLFLDSKRDIRKQEFLRFLPYLTESSIIIWHDSSFREKNHSVYDGIEKLYEKRIIDRILLPTPRGITISKLRGNLFDK